MPRYLNPPTVARPTSRHSHAVALSGSYKRVVVSQQFAVDGAALGVPEQMALAFDNFLAVIASAGCEPRDVVKVTCYCVERGYAAVFDSIREARLGMLAPAIAYMEVAGLSAPSALVAIDGEAVQESAPQR